MKVTLQFLDGQQISYEGVKNFIISEEFLQNQIKEEITGVSEVPTEGNWFMVNPLAIDQNLFKDKRKDQKQEITRQYILEAFEEMKKNPKYERAYKTLVPKKTWKSKTVEELKMLAKTFGDHNADWVEQALEWAQLIVNGESWEDICNIKDTSKCFRLVVWKDGSSRLIGGSVAENDADDSISDVGLCQYYDDEEFSHTVPKVVSYDVHY